MDGLIYGATGTQNDESRMVSPLAKGKSKPKKKEQKPKKKIQKGKKGRNRG